jgi:hypothetical protein
MAVECKGCDHPQSQHKLGKGGCRGCDIGCGRFEPETAPEPVEPVPAAELAAVAEEAPECSCAMSEATFVNCPVHGYDAPDPDAEPLVSARPTPHLDAVKERLAEVERERDRLLENERRWAGEVEQVERERGEARQQRDEAHEELARVDIAAGRDIAKADEPLVDRVADLLRGREEATARALELAAELADLNRDRSELRERIGDLSREVGELTAQLEQATTDHLLAQADVTEAPAILATADSIRDLITQLREQLADHERLDALRVELGQLEERAAVIRSELAEAEKPLPPVVPDKTIREWARKNGFEVDARGRIPVWLRGQYLQAHTG